MGANNRFLGKTAFVDSYSPLAIDSPDVLDFAPLAGFDRQVQPITGSWPELASLDGVVLFGDEGNDYVPPRDPQIVDDPLATDEQDLDSVNNPAYNIVFNFTDGNTSYSAAANAAAAIWELIITADLPDTGGVDDLRVDSRIGLIGDPDGTDGQGNTLANARPTNVRPGTVRAYTGEMGIDPADASNPALTAIIVQRSATFLA